jgi:DNA recombination protein RmuC
LSGLRKESSLEFLFFLPGLILGSVLVFLILRMRHSREILVIQKKQLQEIAGLREELKASEARIEELRTQVQTRGEDIRKLREEITEEKNLQTEAITKLQASEKSLDEQKSLLEAMKKELTSTFNALSSAALKSSSEDFLRLAAEHLGKIVAETKGKLGEHKTSMDSLVRPLQEALKKYEDQIHALESKRRQDYGSLDEQIKLLMSTQQRLQHETSNLVSALRRPQVSGRWGQFNLRRVAELAGMAAHCDFYEQETVSTETARLRPDMIVRLPNDRVIVVDAKSPVDAYLNAISNPNETERQKGMENYVQQVRSHLNTLSSKAYSDQFEHSPEFVVMYLPGESFFSAALEYDPKLIEDGSLKKVILATPTTFIALLKAVAYGWQQAELTKNAQEVSRLGKELYERFAVAMDHFSRTGTHLQKAVESYNDSVRSIESRLLHSVRRFKELGISSAKEVPPLDEIPERPKTLELPQ